MSYYRDVMRKIDTALFRARYMREVNDPSWRAELKPVRQHPRRERRGQARPR